MTPHHTHAHAPVLPTGATFPVIRRFRSATHPDLPHTNIAHYKIHMDRLPKVQGMINLCMISKENDVFLRLFGTHSEMNGLSLIHI